MLPSQPLARPMSIGDLLDRSITIYRRNFRTLVGITAIVSVPLLIIQIVAAVFAFPLDFTSLSRRSTASAVDISMFIYLGVYVIVAILASLASVFEQGAIIAVVSESFQNSSVGIKQAYGRALRCGWALLGAFFLSGLVYAAVLGALFFVFFAFSFGSTALVAAAVRAGASSPAATAAIALVPLCLCAGFIPALILSMLFYIRWIFWPQAIVLETKGVRSGLGRSWRLLRGSFWRVLIIVILMGIFIWIITVTPTYTISFAAILFPSPLVSILLSTTVATIIGIFVSPIRYAILTLLYYDLRIRKEGFDLEMRAKQLAQEAGVP